MAAEGRAHIPPSEGGTEKQDRSHSYQASLAENTSGACAGQDEHGLDNCERTQLHKDFQYAQSTIKRIGELAGIAIFSYDRIHKRQIFGTGTKRVYGYSEQEFADDPDLWRKVIHPDDRALVEGSLPSNEPLKLEYRIFRKDGELRWLEVSLYPRLGEGNTVTVVDGIAVDITERKLYQERLQAMAYTDLLTALPNQTKFNEDLNAAITHAAQGGRPFGVLFIDFDGFKGVNDTFGHEFGDKVLQRIGSLLHECVSESVQVYRMGGDEFTAIVRGIATEQDVVTLAEDISHKFRSPLWLGNQELMNIHCSIGAAVYPQHGQDADTLLRHADVAMYFAKDTGGQKSVLYSPKLAGRTKGSLFLHDALVEALQRQEFKLYFQPQIDAATQQLLGAEALIRWQSPTQGLVSPDGFIPFAEQSGLIWEIGNWALAAACRQNQAWQTQGLPPIRVSVNVSMVQLEHPGFLDLVQRVLEQTGLNPRWLELEITESALVNRLEHAAEVIEQVRGLGVSVAVDDFGVGYSSLQYLAHMHADTLKIDKSFIYSLESNPKVIHIVSAIVQMAHALGMRVVAEGVERSEQLRLLKNVGCDEAQGYLFCPPEPEAEFAAFCRKPK
ncbi:putative bifunctional diguanylate cyclase/phosphodiesterase [Alicyclobacillus herbarius]|uniref:putative bifunctional diguanylate cyclase/phosphodiesterase n=1 Tax=Alicyclobacillus herbarius TaxID=122960 RepID=UPI000417DC37|nr:GGDEF domain-containing phosphodiesterase [Alicyclobacillus herbarius]